MAPVCAEPEHDRPGAGRYLRVSSRTVATLFTEADIFLTRTAELRIRWSPEPSFLVKLSAPTEACGLTVLFTHKLQIPCGASVCPALLRQGRCHIQQCPPSTHGGPQPSKRSPAHASTGAAYCGSLQSIPTKARLPCKVSPGFSAGGPKAACTCEAPSKRCWWCLPGSPEPSISRRSLAHRRCLACCSPTAC